jgi:hypothetical protein
MLSRNKHKATRNLHDLFTVKPEIPILTGYDSGPAPTDYVHVITFYEETIMQLDQELS